MTSCKFYKFIASGSVTTVFLPVISNRETELFEHILSAVGGAVVNYNDFIVFVGLRQDTIESFFEIILSIIRWDANTNCNCIFLQAGKFFCSIAGVLELFYANC
ncbi:hypothetical protein ES703_39204 [subsurface metagenome]